MMVKRKPKNNNSTSNTESLGAPASEGWKQRIKSRIKNDNSWGGLIATILSNEEILDKIKEKQMTLEDTINALKEIGSELKDEKVISDVQERYIDQFARKNSKKFQRINISANEQRDAIYKFLYDAISKNQDNSDKLGKPATQEWKELVKNAVRNHKMWNASIVSFFNAFYDEIAMSEGMDPNELADALKEIGMELQAEGTIEDYNEKLINDAKNELMAKLFYNPLKRTSQAAATNAVMVADQAAEKTEKTIIESIVDKGKIDGKVNLLKQGVALTLNFASTQFDVDDNGIYHNTNELTEDGKIVLRFNTFTPGSKITLKISDRWKDEDYEIHYTTKNGVKNSSFTDFLKYLGYKGKATSLEDIYNKLGEEKFRQVLNVLPIDVSDENGNTIENGIQNVHDINEVTIADFHDQALNSDIANLDVINKKKIDDAYEEYLGSSVDDKEDKKKKFEKLYQEVTGKDISEVWKKAQDIQKQVIDNNRDLVSELRRQIWNAENKTIEAKIAKKEAGAAHFKPSEKQRSVSEAIPTAKIGYIADKTGKISIGSNKFLKRKGGLEYFHFPKAEPGITVVYYEDPLSEDGYGFLLPSTNTEYLIDKGIICASSLINKFGGKSISLYSEEEVRKIVKEFYPNIELSKQQLDNIYQMLRNNHNLSRYPYYESEKGKWKWSATTDLSNISSVYRISETGSVEELNKDDYENLLLKSLGTRETFKNVGTEENPMWTNHAHPEVDIEFEGYQLDEIPKRVTEPSISPVNNAVNQTITQQTQTKEKQENKENQKKTEETTIISANKPTTEKAIKEPNFDDFVNDLINNPFATKEVKERIMNLWLKENKINYKNETKKNSGSPLVERNGQKTKNVNNLLKHKKHTPKFTADFMSLFNRRDGFKYLTHNYDNSRMTLNEFVTEVKKTFEKYRYEKRLPGSLRYLMNMFINGGEWKDFEGKKCSEGYSSDNWIKWSEQNENMHPIMDIGGIEKIIQRFRHTIRIVSPDLLNVIELISQKFPAIEFDYSDQNLGKADFYTNVYILRWGLFGLIKDMADHKDYKNIKIEYKPGFDGDYFIRQIIITQIGSFSQKPIDDVVEKFKSEGGFFAENADKLMGYCNWSVESLWDGKPFRWNILKEESDREIEQIEKESITGFSHILTFYYKD